MRCDQRAIGLPDYGSHTGDREAVIFGHDLPAVPVKVVDSTPRSNVNPSARCVQNLPDQRSASGQLERFPRAILEAASQGSVKVG